MNPEALVVAGVILCLLPVAFGLLVANWKLPWIAEERDSPRVTEMALGPWAGMSEEARRAWGIQPVSDEAWRQEGMRDEGDLYDYREAMLEGDLYRHCDCPMCRDRRSARARS